MRFKIILCLSIGISVYFLLSGCKSEKGNKSNLIEFDVSTSYPEKEIRLDEIADIEYLQLELDEDFLFVNAPHIVTSDKIIISRDGDVLIFSRNGKTVSKFNHKGNGPGEYNYITTLLYDEQADEIFIESRSHNKLFVFSSSGDFRRTIPLFGIMNNMDCQLVNFDSETLLLYDDYNLSPSPFLFISKKDGSVADTVHTPKGEAVLLFAIVDEHNILFSASHRMVKHNDGYLLTDYSTDTVYLLSHDKNLSPVFVRSPKIQSMDPVVYLNSFIEAGNYEFLSAVTVRAENGRLPKTYLMRDRQTGSVYRQKIVFNDYKGNEVFLSPETIDKTQDSRLGLIVLGLDELKNADNENKLGGKLKELVNNSDEDGNDIYMLLHFK
jgi:hypothetical protein